MNHSLPTAWQSLPAIIHLLRFTAWLVLAELVWLLISQPLELTLMPLALTAAITAVLGCLGRWRAFLWVPPVVRKRALGLAGLLDLLALLAVGAYWVAFLRGGITAETQLSVLQSVVLAQFMAGVLTIPFLARTVGRLGALQLIPLIRALVYWAEFVALAALGCWIASFFTAETSFRVMFNYAGGILASGYQLALRNLLVDLLAEMSARVEDSRHSGSADLNDSA